jgi:hypothetical protein
VKMDQVSIVDEDDKKLRDRIHDCNQRDLSLSPSSN